MLRDLPDGRGKRSNGGGKRHGLLYMLSEKLGTGITVGYLHGKMKQQQKDEIMQRFADNQIQILSFDDCCGGWN